MNVKEYMIMAMFDYALPIIKSIHVKIGYKRKKCYRGKGKFMLKSVKEIYFDIQRIKNGVNSSKGCYLKQNSLFKEVNPLNFTHRNPVR